MKSIPAIISIAFFFVCGAYAQVSESMLARLDLVFEEYMKKKTQQIVFMQTSIKSVIYTANYNESSKIYVVKGKYSFKGALNDDDFWVKAQAQIRNGRVLSGKLIDANADFYAQGIGKAFGAALGQTIAEEGSSSGYNLHFTNNCSKKVKLAIRYKDLSGAWRTSGWWTFNPRQSSYLLLGDKRVKTNSDTLYYYAESTDGTYYWGSSDLTTKLDGRTLKMRKVVDKSGDTNWSISCN